MFESWATIFMGWPSAFAAATFLIVGLLARKTWVISTGAFLSAGFCAYIVMNPLPFRLLGLLALAGNVASVVAVHRRRLVVASLCLLPFFGIVVYLVVVLRAA